MYIKYEKLRQALAKTMVETCASEDSLFALCYDVFSGGASTFSSRNPWKVSSYASRQLPPRTYYFNYDRNLVNELFNSYTFSGYSYDASIDTNFDEIYYYNPYLNMQRLFENINRIAGMTMVKQENTDNIFIEEREPLQKEKLNFADGTEMSRGRISEKEGGGLEEFAPDNRKVEIYIVQPPSYSATTCDYMINMPNGGIKKIPFIGSVIPEVRTKTSEGA